LARRTGVPLAAGENLRGIDAFGDALAAEFLSFVQPDVAKWGGISGCREVALLARRHGTIFCPHWLGGGVGLAASMHLRAAMGPEGYAEVDANPNPLREEVFLPGPVDGWVALPDAPGLGVEPDIARLEAYRVRW
jgi:L-alanine-DL-glutamate epimerase-like enolase superfamily enzyme